MFNKLFYRKRKTLEPVYVFSSDKDREWEVNGKLHRLDGPAKLTANGKEEWYREGERFRADGGPNYVDVRQHWMIWWQNDVWHRLDGPARIHPDGSEEWYQEGKLHRLDGPAVVKADGTVQWWQNGFKLTENKYREAVWQVATKLFESKNIENVPFSEIEFVVYLFTGWRNLTEQYVWKRKIEEYSWKREGEKYEWKNSNEDYEWEKPSINK